MAGNQVGDGVSKQHWSELPVGVPSQDVMTTIEKSKVHWSELPGHVPGSTASETGSETLAESEIQERNQTSWKALQKMNPFFFQDWGEKVQVGQQIGEGGQAKIYEATWKKDEYRRLPEHIYISQDMVVKVFKLEGCTLEDFIRQWPRITETSDAELEFELDSEFASFKHSTHVCPIIGAYLLKDKKFVFLMQRYKCDLRSLLDKKMLDNKGCGPPFPNPQDAIRVLLCIARGMQWLHDHGILHRDLKAANVLEGPLGYSRIYVVADYECSMSTIGTGFWRAPEVLQEMQHRSGRNVDIWTTKSDVYSFGMTCFEVLTGGIPFSEYTKKDWTEIIDRNKRPDLPDYVDFKLQQLVKRCWDKDPLKRPSFHDILGELNRIRELNRVRELKRVHREFRVSRDCRLL